MLDIRIDSVDHFLKAYMRNLTHNIIKSDPKRKKNVCLPKILMASKISIGT